MSRIIRSLFSVATKKVICSENGTSWRLDNTEGNEPERESHVCYWGFDCVPSFSSREFLCRRARVQS
jgi:hypothetical protein